MSVSDGYPHTRWSELVRQFGVPAIGGGSETVRGDEIRSALHEPAPSKYEEDGIRRR